MNETATNTGTSPQQTPPQSWLAALTRLWLLRPVGSAPAANPLRAILIMGATWLSVWVAVDRWQSQPDPRFFPSGIPLLAWYTLAILGLAAVLRWRARPAPGFGPALAVTMGAVPAPLLLTGIAAVYLDSRWFLGVSIAVGAYTLMYL